MMFFKKSKIDKKNISESIFEINLIFYDEKTSNDKMAYNYFLWIKSFIKGTSYLVSNNQLLNEVINQLSVESPPPKFILVLNKSDVDKVLPIIHDKKFIKEIFILVQDNHLIRSSLSRNYPKIKEYINDFYTLDQKIKYKSFSLLTKYKSTQLITFSDYEDHYRNLHKLIANYFDENFSEPKFSSVEKDSFMNYMTNEQKIDISNASYYLNSIYGSDSILSNFIKAYTCENAICYHLNHLLRSLDINAYNKIKCFVGTFAYSLYYDAHINSKEVIKTDKIFYRKMNLKLSDLCMYKMCEGELICYPSFTSVSEMDISEYCFGNNEMKNAYDKCSVLLKIQYFYKGGVTPCVNVSRFSINPEEKEYLFPPFSFFKIIKVEVNSNIKLMHTIHMEIPNKNEIIEFMIKKGKKIKYNNDKNEIYFS